MDPRIAPYTEADRWPPSDTDYSCERWHPDEELDANGGKYKDPEYWAWVILFMWFPSHRSFMQC